MNNLAWGLQMTALGMGLVFGLLALLWGLLALALRLDAPVAVTTEGEDEPPPLDPALIAAIAIAVRAHGEQRRAEAAPQVRTHWPGSLLHASRWVAAGRMRQNHLWQRGR